MKPEWYIDLGLGIPDSTTEAIEEIDKRLSVVEDIHNSICMVCFETGLHFH